MANLSWYWHRLRAMSPGEVALHGRKKLRQFFDARRQWDSSALALDCSGAFPKLPRPEVAPQVLREALRRDADNILAGRWKAFGHLELQVDDPPRWHKDYLAGKDLVTDEQAFKLNYRELQDGADIKLIWEPSRWYQLVRLAMAAYVLDDQRAGEKCLDWLEDWVKHNPPYRGWNWTSALEVGIRLVQFTWIDALLTTASIGDAKPALRESDGPPSPRLSPPGEGARTVASEISTVPGAKQAPSNAATGFDGERGVVAHPLSGGEGEGGRRRQITERLERLRREILPPHVRYAWRHKSFGSSANNHLIGELAGLILATVRWPELAKWGASLDELQSRWEREVLAQFAEDGGNREQALNYHLFSWEFCWQAFKALESAGRNVSSPVRKRLSFAARFFWEAQARRDHWDYGDSDGAFSTPFFANEASAVSEWRDWLADSPQSVSIHYWIDDAPPQPRALGKGPPLDADAVGEWWGYRHSGVAMHESGMWWLRWDVSPLGYLSTASHGHLDALHLSVWCKGVALVVDPGTGAYYGDPRLRNWLASRAAHNGPCPNHAEQPPRLGTFLWAPPHLVPTLDLDARGAVGTLKLVGVIIRRRIVHLPNGAGWQVDDECIGKDGRAVEFTTRWQFAPDSWVKRISDRKFSVHRADVAVVMEVEESWAGIELVEPIEGNDPDFLASASPRSLEGIVSPAFRKTLRAPYLKLVARPQGDKPCVFTTTFLVSAN
jgi:hypothetical protein